MGGSRLRTPVPETFWMVGWSRDSPTAAGDDSKPEPHLPDRFKRHWS